MNDMTDTKAPEDSLQQLADHLMAIDALVRTPEIVAQVGGGIEREISYAVSGFRQRFPERFDPQRSLL
jgi:hypothetical protein